LDNRWLAIGLAALFIVCATAGAVVAANDANTADDVNDANNSATAIGSYGSATVERSAYGDTQMVKAMDDSDRHLNGERLYADLNIVQSNQGAVKVGSVATYGTILNESK